MNNLKYLINESPCPFMMRFVPRPIGGSIVDKLNSYKVSWSGNGYHEIKHESSNLINSETIEL